MPADSPSPFVRAIEGLRIVKGAPAPGRPDRAERAAIEKRLRAEAGELLESTARTQDPMTDSGTYELNWLEGRHVVIAGATGQGLGGALAAAVISRLGASGTLTAVARDARYSVGYYTGEALRARAEGLKLGDRFRFLDRGLALEGDPFDQVAGGLKDLGASDVVYLNMVAAANSGVMPGNPPIYVADVDGEGLYQWELQELNERQIGTSRFIMGEMATQFPARLAEAGVNVAVEGYAGWRGSHDKISRLPERPEYGRQGAYSGSLWLPKDVLDEYVEKTHQEGAEGRVVQVHFFPVMRTRALAFIPGGVSLAGIFESMMKAEGIRHVGIPELALSMLDRLGRAVAGKAPCPWQRHDMHEVPLDEWFYHVFRNLSDDESSAYFYKKWVKGEV